MKSRFTRFIMALILLSAMISCGKTDNGKAVTSDVESLTAKAGEAWTTQQVYTDDASQSVSMDRAGIPADFLASEACLDESQGTGNDPELTYIRDHSFVRCLRGLGLSSEQAAAVRQSLGDYSACTEQAVHRAREIYRELKEKYHEKYLRLWNAYQEGTITEREFREKVGELRDSFRAELRRMHLAEKLDDAFARCLRECFRAISNILTERQWADFKACVTG